MAVLRRTLAQLETDALIIFGYSTSALSHWKSAATFYRHVNSYMQRLPMRLNQIAEAVRQTGHQIPDPPRFDMWRSTASLTTTTGSSTVWFPDDYDAFIAFWDDTNDRRIHPIEKVDRQYEKLRNRPAGAPERIEILGFEDNSGTWQRKGVIWPPTMATDKPAVTLTYWRLPAVMPGTSATTEYPDIDPKYESLALFGTVADLARPSSPEFDRYTALERELLVELLMTARSI